MIPSALDHVDEIARGNRQVAVFLDYDGTLTPIVDRPDLAVLSDSMREAVQVLGRQATVAIISGRDLDDLRHRIGIDEIIYAGNHGFDIIGPNGLRKEIATEFLPIVDAADHELRTKVAGISGALVERKRFSIAAHYRLAGQEQAEAIARNVKDVAGRHRELRLISGKKVYELQPDIDWDKGEALLWLINTLRLNPSDADLAYIGDDRTDEDAFRALKERGAGIIVTEQPRPTAARYALRDPAEVERFLRETARMISAGHNSPRK